MAEAQPTVPSTIRYDGRQPHQLRPIRFQNHFAPHATGSTLMVGAYYIHTGQWTYGPRYLLPVLPWLGLPAALGLDRMWQARRHWGQPNTAA